MPVTKIICNSLSDAEIISMSISDIEYFKCLYERYEVRLKRYINKISNFSSDEVEDILQNAFINIWKNIHSYDDSMKQSSFLYRIVHNETVSQWRKQNSIDNTKKNYQNLDSNEEMELLEDESTYKNQIDKILELMSQKYKEVLVLKFLENMDYEEISNILKIPEGTVATRINRAKKAFIKIADKENLSSQLIL